jgi:hypothetical protein
MKNKSVALSRAQSLFTVAERRDDVVKAEIARERAAVDAKTAKLRALRLEKEEADRITKAAFEAANPPPVRKSRTPRVKA